MHFKKIVFKSTVTLLHLQMKKIDCAVSTPSFCKQAPYENVIELLHRLATTGRVLISHESWFCGNSQPVSGMISRQFGFLFWCFQTNIDTRRTDESSNANALIINRIDPHIVWSGTICCSNLTIASTNQHQSKNSTWAFFKKSLKNMFYRFALAKEENLN